MRRVQFPPGPRKVGMVRIPPSSVKFQWLLPILVPELPPLWSMVSPGVLPGIKKCLQNISLWAGEMVHHLKACTALSEDLN